MELSERKKKILCMAVEEYIKDSSPITSGGIKDVTSLNCSTATLRSELNALEAMGFLKQLHTSGGRVPTAQGYRYYVENLLEGAVASDKELDAVQELISSRTSSLSEIVSGIAKIVSEATNYPTVVMVDGVENLVLTDFKIIPLLDDKVMVLIGTIAGYINQTLDVHASIEDCNDASNYLTNNFKGETIGFMLDNIDQFEEGMHSDIKAFENVVHSLINGLKKLNSQRLLNVRREGSAKLLENKNEVESAKKVLDVLDNEKELSSMMELEGKGDIEVTVADEGDASCSVVKAPIVVKGRQLASIGVIGPQTAMEIAIAKKATAHAVKRRCATAKIAIARMAILAREKIAIAEKTVSVVMSATVMKIATATKQTAVAKMAKSALVATIVSARIALARRVLVKKPMKNASVVVTSMTRA